MMDLYNDPRWLIIWRGVSSSAISQQEAEEATTRIFNDLYREGWLRTRRLRPDRKERHRE